MGRKYTFLTNNYTYPNKLNINDYMETFKTWDGPCPLGTPQNMRYFIVLFGGSTFFY